MFKRTLATLAIVVLIAGLLTMPALAGGWAVVTLDELPAQVIAGKPFGVSFVVRAHGQAPVGGLAPSIRAMQLDTGESFSAVAEPRGELGHYAATLTFPRAGAWSWSIDAYNRFNQPMPILTVIASASASVAAAPASSQNVDAPSPLPLAAGILGLVGAVGALVLSLRRRARWAPAALVVAALIGGAGFASAANATLSAPRAVISEGAKSGQALFLAKGCVVCHEHAALREARKEFDWLSVGPNLTNWKADPDYLRRWLKNPAAVKPGTSMPTLDLSHGEIDSLVAFLTSAQ